MAKSNFENLEVYQLAESIADAVWEAAVCWNHFARDTVGKQLVRSADSIGANIAEGAGRGTYLDNRRFIHIARGSLHETKHWLRRAFRRNLLSQNQVDLLRPMLDELGPRLNAYLKSIGRTSKHSLNTDNYPLSTDN
jgi:four helix bundle protein